ncbi:MAG: motility protein A [Bdellovibrio sp. CG10_big_fil_rev_8_21_14_0_10_47_8]|nr:MAG: motility protein A [Bdellovibrio sp. CG10_big_fil_rev_8_21_14_0_10_47_8]
MELTTLFGIILGIGGILLGNVIEGGHIASLGQGAAAVIVFCGTFGAVIVASKRDDLTLAWKLAKEAVAKPKLEETEKIIQEILDCNRFARKESIVGLEPRISKLSNNFLQSVLRGVVDGIDAKVLRDVFETQIHHEEEKMLGGAKVWTDAGGFAPTIGIIGAVLGLIHVMGNLSDTSKLGAGIAVAFVATIYGVGSANLILLPFGSKVKKYVHHRTLIKEMILEGGLSIQMGLSPTLTEMKLRSFVDKVKA